ncbi:hypothetical protein ACC698_37750, partial [Rhizobium johnstonii]
ACGDAFGRALGCGRVSSSIVGVLLNGLTMLKAPYYTQDFVKGAVLVGALALNYGLGRSNP